MDKQKIAIEQLVTPKRESHVAVIGSGLAGLTTAYLLARAGLCVSLYERESQIGMDSQSITVPCIASKEKESIRVQTPMRSFSAGYYPALFKVYRHLSVPMQSNTFSFNFFDASTGEIKTAYYGAGGLQGFTTSHTWKDTCLIILGFLYYALLACFLTVTGLTRRYPFRRMSHAQFCKIFSIPSKFVDDLLNPLFMGVATCSNSELARYPAAYLLEYRARTMFRSHYITDVSQVAQRLSKPLSHIYLGVEPLVRDEDRTITCQSTTRTYNHIVYAFPPDDVPYTKTSVITHRSSICMPKGQPMVLNLGCHKTYTSASHLISAPENLVQTTLPTQFASVIPYYIARSDFKRAIVSVTNLHIIDKYLSQDGNLSQENGRNNIYQVGSFVCFGIPLLEGCVTSARLVAVDILRKEGLDDRIIQEIFS